MPNDGIKGKPILMTLLAWILLLAFVLFIVICFGALSHSKKERKPVDVLSKLLIALLAIVIGVLAGFLLFIPLYLLVCVFCPNTPVDGHVVMPLGQAIIGAFLALICGLTITIISYDRILRWRKI